MSNVSKEDAKMLEEANKWIEWAEALERLERNEDFKKVFLEGYLKERAVDAVSLLARGDIKANGKRPDVIEYLVGISQFEDFMHTVKTMGANAKQDLEMNEEENED